MKWSQLGNCRWNWKQPGHKQSDRSGSCHFYKRIYPASLYSLYRTELVEWAWWPPVERWNQSLHCAPKFRRHSHHQQGHHDRLAVNTIMKKPIIYLSIIAALVAGYAFAQDFGQPMHREFFRNVKLNANRTDQLNAIWDAIDSKKPNTTLIRIMLTRDGTNDVTIGVMETVRVKIVED